MKKITFNLLFSLLIFCVGCANKQDDSKIEIGAEQNEYEIVNENENNYSDSDWDMEEIPEEEVIYDQVAEDSQLWIENVLGNGIMWGEEKDVNGIKSIVKFDVNGTVYNRIYEDEIEGSLCCGIDDNIFVTGDMYYGSYHPLNTDDVYIYNANTKENITSQYLSNNGDSFDKISGLIEYQDSYLFVRQKLVDTFEESYFVFEIIDIKGNVKSSISLDYNTLAGLGLYKDYDVYDADIMPTMISKDGVYCIKDVGYPLNEDGSYTINVDSVLVNMNNNNYEAVERESLHGIIGTNKNYICYKSGGYSGSLQLGITIYDINNGEYKSIVYERDDVYDSRGYAFKLLENNAIVIASSEAYLFIIDTNGNTLADLRNYSATVSDIVYYKDNKYLLQFSNGYIGILDQYGNLYEPVKGSLEEYNAEQDLIFARNDEEYFILGENGEITTLPGEVQHFYVEYENKKYWLICNNNRTRGDKAIEAFEVNGEY